MEEDIRDEIARLEASLAAAKSKLNSIQINDHNHATTTTITTNSTTPPELSFDLPPLSLSLSPATSEHALLLLSDSALPLGSFAFSSGLESYLAHHRSDLVPGQRISKLAHFDRFLDLSLHSVAQATLPYLLSGYRDPTSLVTLDNNLDASTPCTVARRASIAQGRALLGVWDKAFKSNVVVAGGTGETGGALETDGSGGTLETDGHAEATRIKPDKRKSRLVLILETFHKQVKSGGMGVGSVGGSSTQRDTNTNTNNKNRGQNDGQEEDDEEEEEEVFYPSGHFAPVFGAVSLAMGLSAYQAAYVYLFGHVRAVISAAVRAGVMGPYQAQTMLASQAVQKNLQVHLREAWDCHVDDTGQVIPAMDLWVGRHELLYSRIFNS
ncbi:hypothetical protein L228DRAFT_250924 [Xylona heveae TC161]|uniref:Urease accessory protein UreF n=1 Tax=Xylona heveae (strain CBS 132557 / TC161) TaxID=1328760 RepID=A0A164ZP66_XYLHT|nr:hypothetical protein L228DRAFT_250924 [Xylona heveae TC161]KZF19336.1 hypothetical protein L228DRAFT_250924 [Xylona heveae TC161]